jgi:hypothetical protein
VLELGGRIVWMRGVELQPEPGIAIKVTSPDGAVLQTVQHPVSPLA